MDSKNITAKLGLKVGMTYTKASNTKNIIEQIDDEKIKYSTGQSSKYIKNSLLLSCYEKLFEENELLTSWIRQNKIQTCEPQLILAIFVKAKLGNYISENRIRPVGIRKE